MGSLFPFPFPPFLSKRPGQSLTAAPQAGKPTVRKNCRKPSGWEKVGWKASLSEFYFQVLLSQPLHAPESLCSSSSLRTRNRQRDLHRAALCRAKLRGWGWYLKWSDERYSLVKRKDAKWLIYNIISSWLADAINICACVICFSICLQLCPFSAP